MRDKKILHIPTLADCFFEQKKNEFLGAVYENNLQDAENTFLEIVDCAESLTRISENSEKYLHQVRVIFKRFFPLWFASSSSRGPAEHSNRMIQAQARMTDLVLGQIKQAPKNICYVEFTDWDAGLALNRDQKKLLYKTAMTFQLTSGCSNYCRRCNEWALPRVRSHFSYTAILKILERMAEQHTHDISLFGASDPLDWKEGDKNLLDILDGIKGLPIQCSLLTKVPRGKESLLKVLVQTRANLSVSLTARNRSRIQAIEQEMGIPIPRQHELDELLIPAGLDEDFSTIKPSITDGYGTEITPDGAWIIIPTFTSALYPFGHQKIPVTDQTSFFPVRRTGREALLFDYFKPLEGYDINHNHGRTRCRAPHLLDVQVESIMLDNGTDDLTPPGMRSLKEYLSVFEEPARIQRKKNCLSVIRRFKREALTETRFSDLPMSKRVVYQKKINAYLNLCRPAGCLQAKLHAISFFLAAVLDYREKNPTKLQIMQFLLKEEMLKSFDTHAGLPWEVPLDIGLRNSHLDSFELFRFAVFCILDPLKTDFVQKFLSQYPAAYDPLADIFVPEPHASADHFFKDVCLDKSEGPV